MKNCQKIIEKYPEDDVILSRGNMKSTPANKEKTICENHRKALGEKFERTFNIRKMTCASLNHGFVKVLSRKPCRVTMQASKVVIEAGGSYAPFHLPVCDRHLTQINAYRKAEDRQEEWESDAINQDEGQPSFEKPNDPKPMNEYGQFREQSTMEGDFDATLNEDDQLRQENAIEEELEASLDELDLADQSFSSDSTHSDPHDKDYDPKEGSSTSRSLPPNVVALNNLLIESSMTERLKAQLQMDYIKADESRKRHLQRIVAAALVSTLRAITPNKKNQLELMKDVIKKKKIEMALDEIQEEQGFMPSIIKDFMIYYNSTEDRNERLKCIAILSQYYTYAELKRYNPPRRNSQADTSESEGEENVRKAETLFWKYPLTKYFFHKARLHFKLNGHGIAPVLKKQRIVHRIKPEVVEAIYSFITSNEITKAVAFGTYRIKKSDGSSALVAKNIRNFNKDELVRKIQHHLQNLKFSPGSIPQRTYIRNLLDSLPAKRAHQMRGITTAVDEGHRAFETLAEIVKEMEQRDKSYNAKTLNSDTVNNLLSSIDTCYVYHKSNFVFNIETHSRVKSHCINYLCSDPKNQAYVNLCEDDPERNENVHDETCNYCQMFSDVCQSLIALCTKLEEASIDDLKVEEWRYDINEAEKAIIRWRNFIIRNKINNQQWGKTLTTENSTLASVIFDFAMKFEPQKNRETQEEWFGK